MSKTRYLAVPVAAAAATVGAGQAEAAVLITQNFSGLTVANDTDRFEINIGGNSTAQYVFRGGSNGKAFLSQNDGLSEVGDYSAVASIDSSGSYSNEAKTGGNGYTDGYFHLRFALNGTTTYGYAAISAEGYRLDSITYEAPVPEPTTWALMILGFGATGAALRRRRQSAGLVSA